MQVNGFDCAKCSKTVKSLCKKYKEERRIFHGETDSENLCILNRLANDGRYRTMRPREARLRDEVERKSKQPIMQMSHPERRKAREKKLLSTLSEKQWDFIKNVFNDKCCYCGKKRKLTKDHYLALTSGGACTHRNILPACRQCNSSKNDSDAMTWYKKQSFYNAKRERLIYWLLNYGK